MIKRILVFGAAILVFATAITLNLWILDLVTLPALNESLSRISSIIAVTTGATLAIGYLARLASRK